MSIYTSNILLSTHLTPHTYTHINNSQSNHDDDTSHTSIHHLHTPHVTMTKRIREVTVNDEQWFFSILFLLGVFFLFLFLFRYLY